MRMNASVVIIASNELLFRFRFRGWIFQRDATADLYPPVSPRSPNPFRTTTRDAIIRDEYVARGIIHSYIHYRINTRCNYRRICPFVPGNFFFLSIIIYPNIFLNISKGFLFERIFPRASFNMGDLPSNLKFNWKIHFLFSLFSCKYRRITFSINTSTCYFPMISNDFIYYFYYLKRENDTNRLDYPKMFNIRNSRVEDRRLFREGTRGYPRAW